LRGDKSPETSRAFVEEILTSLRKRDADTAALVFVDVNSPIRMMARQLPSVFCRDFLAATKVHWKMELAENIDEVWRRFSGDHRRQLRRKARKLHAEFGEQIRVSSLRGPADVDRIMQDAEQVARTTYQRGLGVGFSATDEMRKRLSLQAQKDWLRAYILYISNAPCAFWIGSLYKGVFYSDYLAHDPGYDKHSVGTFLTMNTIEALCGEGAKGIDFGPGHSRYKQQFSNSRHEESTVYIFAPTIKGIGLNVVRTFLGLIDSALKMVLQHARLLSQVKRLARWRISQRETSSDTRAAYSSSCPGSHR